MFEAAFPIADLRPADYNPRRISDEALGHLVDGLKAVGIIKPVVALRSGLIVAGHQRTRAAKIAGFVDTPVCFLSKQPNPQDEIRFNQLHNGTDLDSGEEKAVVDPSETTGFAMATLRSGNHRAPGASVRAELARLLTAYGNWGGCVAALDGTVISGSSYALAAAVIGMQARTYYVADADIEQVATIFGRAYGQYSYESISRKTFNQTFAQMYRLRGGKRDNSSPTYEWLIPATEKSARILDFGCGQGDYVRALRKAGYDIHGLEFFRRKGGKLDPGASNRMIDNLIHEVKTNGLFDVVICDYVLNSVDTQQAEDDVMACVNGFLKMGGRAFFSGRRIERLERDAATSRHSTSQRQTEFLDENNISALFRGGEWFFQKFHTLPQIEAIVTKHFRDDGKHDLRNKSSAWQLTTIKSKPATGLKEAIEREFNLPLPSGRSFNPHSDVLEAMAAFI